MFQAKLFNILIMWNTSIIKFVLPSCGNVFLVWNGRKIRIVGCCQSASVFFPMK